MTCEMHGNPSSFYCRQCGEMMGCDKALDALDTPDEFMCACACHRIERNVRIIVAKDTVDGRETLLDVTHKIVFTVEQGPTPFEVFAGESSPTPLRITVSMSDPNA